MILENDYLRIGKVVGSHALNGRLRIYVTTDILSRFAAGKEIYLSRAGKNEKKVVKDFKLVSKKDALLQLEGIDDRNAADSLRGAELLIMKETAEESRKDLDEGSFYYYDLIGLKVFLDNKEYGSIVDIMEAGAGDIFIIENIDGAEVLVPFIDGVVEMDRMSEGIIDIFPIEGMLDL